MKLLHMNISNFTEHEEQKALGPDNLMQSYLNIGTGVVLILLEGGWY